MDKTILILISSSLILEESSIPILLFLRIQVGLKRRYEFIDYNIFSCSSYHFCMNKIRKPSNLKEQRGRALRSNKKIIIKEERIKNHKYEKSYIVNAIKYCDQLPVDLKKVRNLHNFKCRTSHELMANKLNFPE